MNSYIKKESVVDKKSNVNGIEDLPDEFDSWVKTLVPEERDDIVKLFWD